MGLILTEEQKAIINYNDGDQIIEAGAGCGKSSTLIQKALANQNLKKLYFSFNSAIVKEMKEKAYKAGVKNIDIVTFHSFAHTKFIKSNQYKLGYNPTVYGITKEFGLKGDNTSNKIVYFAIKWFELFCNSDLESILDLKFIDTIEGEKAKKYVDNFYNAISNMAFDIWSKMDNKKLDCSHSFYLKKYQLTHPTLNYDLVLIDEAQDLSPVQLSIVKGLNGRKVVVGDSNQQIYAWRGAVNALKAFPNYKVFTLTESFRFTQDIADIGLKALSYKETYDSEFDFSKLRLIGRATLTPEIKIKTKAILSRSNISILEYLFTNLDNFKSIYIEGGLDSLIQTQAGIKLTDLVYLICDEKDKIENFFVKKFANIDKLKEYYEDLDDTSINSMVNFVTRYKKQILFQLVRINEKLTEKQFADVTFSTLHKSKGTEFDEVEILANTELDWFPHSIPRSKQVDHPEGGKISVELEEYELKKLKLQACEELNLRYVAVTRAKYKLYHNWDYLDDIQQDEVEEMDKIKEEIANG